ncbi:MAG: BamA/TamA family outer membrane protein [Planctomycetaceae bacterium]
MDDTGPFDGPLRGRARRTVPPAAALLVCALSIATVTAQDVVPPELVPGATAPATPLEQPLADVQVEGNRTIPTTAISQHIKARPGRAVSDRQISEDVQSLLRTRWFLSVEPRVTYTEAGNVLVFSVIERPIVKLVDYRGNEKIKDKNLTAITNLKPGSPFDPNTNIECARRIEADYHDKGYAFAKVTLTKGGDREDREVIFDIVEGEKVRVDKVWFNGNEKWYASDGYLKTKLQTETMWWPLPVGGIWKPDTVQNDVAALKQYYIGLGFFDVRIDHEIHFNDDKSRVRIEYKIDEGTRYLVTGIRYEGNQVYSVEELAADRQLNPGDYFNEAHLNKDLAKIQDLYGSLGRLFASVTPDPYRYSEKPGETVLVYKIDEDRPYYVRNINVNIRGEHPHTRVTLPLNMSRIHPGDLADPKKIRQTKARIEGSAIFERGLGEGVEIDIKRVGFDEEEGAADPLIRGQSDDDVSPFYVPQTSGYRASGAAAGGSRAASVDTSDNPFALQVEVAPVPAGVAPATAPAGQSGAYAPAVNRPRRPMPAGSSVTQIAGTTPTGVSPPTSQTTYNPPPAFARQVAYEEPPQFSNDFVAAPGPVRTAQGVVNPYAQPPVIQPLAGQVGDYSPPWVPSSPQGDPFADYGAGQQPGFIDLGINATEARTGRFMVGAGVNSNSGVVGNIVLTEDNFDILRFPRSPADIVNGTAWRGAGQKFRIEAVPGNVVSRYLVSWTDPYFLDSDYSLGLSGFYFQRFYPDWDEERAGGRVNIGRQLTQNLSIGGILRAENVDISNPDVPTPPLLADVVGDNMLLTAGGALTWDTRDSPLVPSEGQFAELTYTQGIEDFVYPRVDLEATQYFTVFSRPDGTGKHILSVGGQAGWTGDDTPIFERYYAGGFQSLRGFEFRGVGPRQFGVNIGGQFLVAGSVQYMFPLLANDALHGVVFSDFGTVEEDVQIDDFRASVGTGLRITIPAFGPAPLAFDFAFPIAKADGDETQIFSFYVGMQR